MRTYSCPIGTWNHFEWLVIERPLVSFGHKKNTCRSAVPNTWCYNTCVRCLRSTCLWNFGIFSLKKESIIGVHWQLWSCTILYLIFYSIFTVDRMKRNWKGRRRKNLKKWTKRFSLHSFSWIFLRNIKL